MSSRKISDTAGAGEDRRLHAFLLAVMILGCLARVVSLSARSLWDDEAFTYFYACQGLRHLLASLPFDRHPPFFMTLVAGSVRLLGASELALRLPSLLAGIALVPVTAWIGTRLWDRTQGLKAAALMSASPLLIYASQEARSYSLLVLCMFVSAWAFWEHAERPRWSTGLLAVIASWCGMYSHYFGTFSVVFAFLILVLRGRRSPLRAAAPLLVTGIGMVPLLLLMAQQRRTAYTTGISFSTDGTLPGPVAALRSLLLLGNGGFTEGAVKLLGFAGFAAVVAAVLWVRFRSRAPRPSLTFPLLLAGSLFVLMYACAMVLHWPLRDSYQAILAPAIYLALAAAIPLQLRAGRVALLALLLVMASGSVPLALGKGRQNPDFRSGAKLVAQIQPDGVLLARGWGDLACYEFYRAEHAPTAAYALDPIQHPSEEVRVVDREFTTPERLLAAQPRRVCVLGKDNAQPGFHWMADFLQQHGYAQSSKQHFEGLDVLLWERKAPVLAGNIVRPAENALNTQVAR